MTAFINFEVLGCVGSVSTPMSAVGPFNY